MLESATRSALRGIEAGVTPKLREVRVGSEDRLMTNGLRPSADAAATTKALEAAFRAPVGARGRAVEKVIAERLEGLSPGEMVQVTAQMLRQIAGTSQQTDAVFGRRTSDLRTHFFPHEFKAIQEAIYWAFQRNGVWSVKNEFGVGDADKLLRDAMSQPTHEGYYRNFGPDGAVFDHWSPAPTFR
jgi:uncharacterized protein YoaH (UPF0181 family)